MIVMSVLENLLLMIGGITVFLFGLTLMSDSLQSIAGEKLRAVLARVTGSPLKGVLAGTGVTAVVQSSTAVNIMLVGFVNVGAIGLKQAIPVVMGSNIGTTVTAQLVSLSGSNALDITALGSLAAFIGFLLTFTKNSLAKKIGGVLLGFGMIFIGLEIMNTSICAFRTYAFFRRLFMAGHPLLMLMNGFLLTAVVQSSSAVSSVMIILALNGLITFESGMYLLLGTNIGAGVAVLIVSSNMTKEARQVAVANVLFNVVGTAIMLLPIMTFEGQVAAFFAQISGGIERQIANFHTMFNLLVTIILLPFVGAFERLVVAVSSPLKLKGKSQGARRKAVG